MVSLRDPGSFIDLTYKSTGAVSDTLFRGSGTSQAAAVMSGAVALLLQQHPELTPDQVKRMLMATAANIGGTVTSAAPESSTSVPPQRAHGLGIDAGGAVDRHRNPRGIAREGLDRHLDFQEVAGRSLGPRRPGPAPTGNNDSTQRPSSPGPAPPANWGRRPGRRAILFPLGGSSLSERLRPDVDDVPIGDA
jgi:hypothetical protein